MRSPPRVSRNRRRCDEPRFFARAGRNWTIPAEIHVRSWLFTIAHNTITDQYRNAAKSQELPLDETWDTIDDEPTPEDTVIFKENQDMVRQLLTFLSPDQRRVVELRLADLTGPEIQQVLGKTRSWVNTTQFRAVQRMRAALDEMGGGSHV